MSALVHDDILDRANIRRGQPSINALYGKDNALLLGDYFYSSLAYYVRLISYLYFKEGIESHRSNGGREIKQQQQAF